VLNGPYHERRGSRRGRFEIAMADDRARPFAPSSRRASAVLHKLVRERPLAAARTPADFSYACGDAGVSPAALFLRSGGSSSL
jgi:hypothetical protein